MDLDIFHFTNIFVFVLFLEFGGWSCYLKFQTAKKRFKEKSFNDKNLKRVGASLNNDLLK